MAGASFSLRCGGCETFSPKMFENYRFMVYSGLLAYATIIITNFQEFKTDLEEW